MYNVVGMWRRNFKLKGIRAFTLVELLVTIAVVASISAGVAALIGPGSRRQSRDAQRKSDLEKIRSALELYRNDVGYYPRSGVADSPTASLTLLVTAGYLQEIPVDPSSPGRTYDYEPFGCSLVSGSLYRCPRYYLCSATEGISSPNTVCTNIEGGGAQGECGATEECDYGVRNP